MISKKVAPFLTFIFLIFIGCNSDTGQVDISHIDLDSVEIKRFERELFKSSLEDLDSSLLELSDEYWPFFQEKILDSNYLKEV